MNNIVRFSDGARRVAQQHEHFFTILYKTLDGKISAPIMRTSSPPRQREEAAKKLFKNFKKQPISVGICVAADAYHFGDTRRTQDIKAKPRTDRRYRNVNSL